MILENFRDGIPPGFGLRVAGGRTIYTEAGSMWRERSDTFTYLATGDRRRYLPSETHVELIPLEGAK